MSALHAIPPGLWCVPSALAAITGADVESVIHPALNRHGHEDTLTGLVTGVYRHVTLAALEELGWVARRYKGRAGKVAALAALSAQRWPGHTLLVFTTQHALVVRDGRVYDSWAPHGPAGADHPYADEPVNGCYLVQRR